MHWSIVLKVSLGLNTCEHRINIQKQPYRTTPMLTMKLRLNQYGKKWDFAGETRSFRRFKVKIVAF
jgi:hypothetical protein